MSILNSLSAKSRLALLQRALIEKSKRHPEDPLLFAGAHRRLNGQLMTIPPIFHDIYRDRHPFLAIQKPAQVGGTEFAVNLALWAAATRLGNRGAVILLAPTQRLADEISQVRFQSAIDESPTLTALAHQHDERRPPQRVDARTIGGGIVHFRGADSPRQYQGIPADLVIIDEFNAVREEVFENAVARLGSSTAGQLVVISTPTTPQTGINALIERSDERHYQLLCSACNHFQEPEYPQHFDSQSATVRCSCGAELRYSLPGRWSPAYPDRGAFHGYLVNRLAFPEHLLLRLQLAATDALGLSPETFHRNELGLTYMPPGARLTIDDTSRLLGPPGVSSRAPTHRPGRSCGWNRCRKRLPLDCRPRVLSEVSGTVLPRICREAASGLGRATRPAR